MYEVTRVITMEATVIAKDIEEVVTVTEDMKRIIAKLAKSTLNVDDVVVTKVQDFLLEKDKEQMKNND